MKKGICCYCGSFGKLTRDHIPPKSIFPKPRPKNLITVPCCEKCNANASVLDERFKAFLGMHIARQGGEAERLFKEGVIPTMSYNGKLRKKVMESIYPVLTATDSGIITGKGVAVPWDNEAHDTTIERITRGLFYYHYKKIVSSETPPNTYWFKSLPSFEPDTFDTSTIAEGKFTYYHRKVDNRDFDSVWLYSFYGAHFAGAIILTSNGPD